MKRIAFSSLAIAMTLSACATPPEKIAAVPNAGACTVADQQRLAILTNQQTRTVNNDALGVFLIGLPVGSMGGGDHEAEIAILKGRCMRPGAGAIQQPARPNQHQIPTTVVART